MGVICSRCAQERNVEEFALKSKLTGKRHSVCKICFRAANKKRYVENPTYYVEKSKVNRGRVVEALRLEMNRRLRASTCRDCGETNTKILSFDRAEGSSETVCYMITNGRPKDLILREMELAPVICKSCKLEALEAKRLNAQEVHKVSAEAIAWRKKCLQEEIDHEIWLSRLSPFVHVTNSFLSKKKAEGLFVEVRDALSFREQWADWNDCNVKLGAVYKHNKFSSEYIVMGWLVSIRGDGSLGVDITVRYSTGLLRGYYGTQQVSRDRFTGVVLSAEEIEPYFSGSIEERRSKRDKYLERFEGRRWFISDEYETRNFVITPSGVIFDTK